MTQQSCLLLSQPITGGRELGPGCALQNIITMAYIHEFIWGHGITHTHTHNPCLEAQFYSSFYPSLSFSLSPSVSLSPSLQFIFSLFILSLFHTRRRKVEENCDRAWTCVSKRKRGRERERKALCIVHLIVSPRECVLTLRPILYALGSSKE